MLEHSHFLFRAQCYQILKNPMIGFSVAFLLAIDIQAFAEETSWSQVGLQGQRCISWLTLTARHPLIPWNSSLRAAFQGPTLTWFLLIANHTHGEVLLALRAGEWLPPEAERALEELEHQGLCWQSGFSRFPITSETIGNRGLV